MVTRPDFLATPLGTRFAVLAGFVKGFAMYSFAVPASSVLNQLSEYELQYSLNSLKGGYIGDNIGEYHRAY